MGRGTFGTRHHHSSGPVTPVGIEQAVEQLEGIDKAAAVGVGPVDNELIALVIEAPSLRPGVAPVDVTEEIRSRVDVSVVAVLVTRELPVDIRHNSKIDRARVSDWASKVLAGEGSARL